MSDFTGVIILFADSFLICFFADRLRIGVACTSVLSFTALFVTKIP